MDLEWHNKRALVTSGSRGIGKAIARSLAREGLTWRLLRVSMKPWPRAQHNGLNRVAA